MRGRTVADQNRLAKVKASLHSDSFLSYQPNNQLTLRPKVYQTQKRYDQCAAIALEMCDWTKAILWADGDGLG